MMMTGIRRCFGPGCLALVVLASGALSARGAEEPAAERLTLTVSETAGIRRWVYPVSVVLPLGRPLREGDRFRLLDNGRPLAAQFRPVRPARGAATATYLDFSVSPGPLEKHTYVVEYGPAVTAGPEPRGGLKVETGEDALTVSHGPGPAFVLPRNLLGLLRGVRVGETEYLRPGSRGLLLRDKEGGEVRAGSSRTEGAPPGPSVTRSGPQAVEVRFEGTEKLGERKVASTVDVEFTRFKWWVRITWTVDDPKGSVAGLGADLLLNVPAAPVLVDFGAGSYVYTALRRGQAAVLRAGSLKPGDPAKPAPAWETLVGPAGALRPYVRAAPGEKRPAEGWAHVMDRQRCTAVAVEGFTEPNQQAEIKVDADGRLQVWRSFAEGGTGKAGPKRLSFWLHFVPAPIHVGAVTSPQAMLAPLRVEVKRPAR